MTSLSRLFDGQGSQRPERGPRSRCMKSVHVMPLAWSTSPVQRRALPAEVLTKSLDPQNSVAQSISCSSVARMPLATDRVLLVVLMRSNCRAPIAILDFVRAEKSSHVRSVDAGVILPSIMIRKVRRRSLTCSCTWSGMLVSCIIFSCSGAPLAKM